MTLPRSYLKFNYALRPAKQVERKLLVEALLRLGSVDYAIQDYTYLGFGSPYYADFQVFNRYLYIDKMICVEGSNIPKRMDLNRPFGSIDLRLGMLKEIIPSLERQHEYFAWPDFDAPLDREMMSDVRSLVSILAPGSILVVTVDAEARVEFEHPLDKRTQTQILADRVEYINEQLGNYLAAPVKPADYNNAKLPTIFALALQSAIRGATNRRGDVEYCQLFNYRYKDGAQMLSMGGLVDTPDRIERLRSTSFMQWPHLNPDGDPVQVFVPPLTPLERQRLDVWATEPEPRDALPFELDDDHVAGFVRYRRYYPQYFEAIV